MPFVTPDYPAIRDAILRDLANQIPNANTASDGDFAIRANATAAAIEGLYQHQQWLVRQILPDTADADYLERWASLFGIMRKAASMATGTIEFSGLPGSPIPIGTEAKTNGGVAFVTTVSGTLSAGGSATLAAQAVLVGSAGNQEAGTALTLTAAPTGLLSTGLINTMTGGADIESDASLLARLLDRLRYPPHGGAAHDYLTWALEVSGVTAAYVYPLRRGPGTVDVIIMAAGGLPDMQLIATAQSHIDYLRPVTADCLVFGPTAISVNVTASLVLSGTTLAAASLVISNALSAYFASLKPGDTAYLSRISGIISNTPGVVDFTLTAPGANVTTVVDSLHAEMPVLGAVALS